MKDDLTSRLLEQLGNMVWDAGPEVAEKAGDFLTEAITHDIRLASQVQIAVVIDHQAAQDVNGRRAIDLVPSLVHIIARCMAALTGAAKQQLPHDWTIVFRRGEHLMVKTGTRIELSLESKTTPLPPDYQGCLALLDDHSPTVLLENDGPSLSWRALKNARTAIAQAIGYAGLASEFYAAFTALAEQEIEPDAMPADIDWTAVDRELQLSVAGVRKAVAAIGGSRDWAGRFLSTLVVYYKGTSALDQLNCEGPDAASSELLQRAIAIVGCPDVDHARLSRLETMMGFEELLEEFGLDLDRLNRALLEVGERQLDYGESHLNSLQSFLSLGACRNNHTDGEATQSRAGLVHHFTKAEGTHSVLLRPVADLLPSYRCRGACFSDRLLENDRIMDRVRLAHLSTFQRFGDLSQYLGNHESIQALQPDPEWSTTVRHAPQELLNDFVTTFIDSLKLPTPAEGAALFPLSEVRNYNGRYVRTVVRTAAPLVRAWCHKNNVPPGVWGAANLEEGLLNTLDDRGALDFTKLDEATALKWLEKLDLWPSLMPATTNQEDLHLSDDDLDGARLKAAEKEREQELKRRSITFGDQLLDPIGLDAHALADQFVKLAMPAVAPPNLNTTSKRGVPRGSKSSHAGGGGKAAQGHLSEQQRDLVGFLGELAAYQWLKRILPRQDIDSAWVSRYREKLLPGRGNDSLGYDFEVVAGGKKLFLEVKGHLQDPMVVELGETEVIAAQDCARRRRDYRIVYVSRLGSPESMRVEVLPNPLGVEGQTVYRLDDKGLRYRFSR